MRLDTLRAPVVGLVVAAGLLLVAALLDAGSAGQRDAALLLGSLTLYLLLPAAALWLLVAAVRHRWDGSRARR